MLYLVLFGIRKAHPRHSAFSKPCHLALFDLLQTLAFFTVNCYANPTQNFLLKQFTLHFKFLSSQSWNLQCWCNLFLQNNCNQDSWCSTKQRYVNTKIGGRFFWKCFFLCQPGIMHTSWIQLTRRRLLDIKIKNSEVPVFLLKWSCSSQSETVACRQWKWIWSLFPI